MLLLANTIFASLVFVADLYLPTKISVEIPYVTVVISSALCTSNNYYVKYSAFLCSVFIIIDYIFSAATTTVLWEELLQRLEILVVIWMTTSVLYLEKNLHNKLQNIAAKQLKILNSSEEKLSWLASHDELTSVYNRRFFNTQLKKEWQILMRNKLPISLIMIDVDFFKQYNDTLGHSAGDNCLKLIAREMQNQLNRPADFLVRYGGEEFAVVLPDTDLNGAVYIALTLKESIYNLKIFHPSSKLAQHVTISLGISMLIPSPQITTDDLIRKADYALYQAKSLGRNRFVVYAEETKD